MEVHKEVCKACVSCEETALSSRESEDEYPPGGTCQVFIATSSVVGD